MDTFRAELEYRERIATFLSQQMKDTPGAIVNSRALRLERLVFLRAQRWRTTVPEIAPRDFPTLPATICELERWTQAPERQAERNRESVKARGDQLWEEKEIAFILHCRQSGMGYPEITAALRNFSGRTISAQGLRSRMYLWRKAQRKSGA